MFGAPGFRIFENIFDEPKCDSLAEALSTTTMGRSKAGARHLLSIPEIVTLANDSRLLAVAEGELGTQVTPFRATLFAKTSSANWLTVWHQDTALPLKHRFDAEGWGPWSQKLGVFYAHAPSWALSRVIALRIHLDSSRANNGPLRVLPNSHILGVLTDDDVTKLSQERSFRMSCDEGWCSCNESVDHPFVIEDEK